MIKPTKILPLLITLAFTLHRGNHIFAADFETNLSSPTIPAQRKAIGFEWVTVNDNQSYISALKPFSLKAVLEGDTPASYQKIISYGARPQAFVGNWGIGWWPWEDWARWENYVNYRIDNLTSQNEKWEWIVWQEPDSDDPGVWQGSQSQFFETWRRAVQILRTRRPNDIIIGPSTWYFNEAWLKSFLLFSKTNRVLPDVLSWHELFDIGREYNVDGSKIIFSPPDIYAHAGKMRQFMSSNSINIPRINITEYQGRADNYRPGATIHYIANLERAQIEGTKGNWGGDDPYTLSGLMTARTNGQPRSIWWAYKGYADITGQLTTVTKATAIDGVTGIDQTKKESRTILGNIGPVGNKTITYTNIPSFLLSNGEVAVETHKIPNSETAALTNPTRIYRYNAKPTNNSLTVELPQFGPNEAYTVRLWNPGIISTSPSPSPSPKPGDFNGDGFVNLYDYSTLISGFGTRYTIYDYNTFLANYGK